jgi:prevent-host-death family protein
MSKRIRATDAKNNFGGMLEDVATLGRVEIVRHGRVVAIVVSPSELERLGRGKLPAPGRSTHMIPADLARAARVTRAPRDFEDGWE